MKNPRPRNGSRIGRALWWLLASVGTVLLTGAGCYCNPVEPPNFVYSCSGSFTCPANQTCGVCNVGGQVPAGSRVCGPPLTPGICEGWAPIMAASTLFAADVNLDGYEDLVAAEGPDTPLDAADLPTGVPDLVLEGEKAEALAGAPTAYVWLARP